MTCDHTGILRIRSVSSDTPDIGMSYLTTVQIWLLQSQKDWFSVEIRFFVIEFPYLVNLLNGMEFDTMYHEHVFHFSTIPCTFPENMGSPANMAITTRFGPQFYVGIRPQRSQICIPGPIQIGISRKY